MKVIKKNIILLALLNSITTVYAQDNSNLAPEFLQDVSQSVSPKTARDMIDEFHQEYSKKGWQEGEFTTSNGSKAILATGIATISVDRSSPDFILSREIAFQKALLDAKTQILQYLESTISSEIESEFSEPSKERQEKAFEEAKKQGLMIQAAADVSSAALNDTAGASKLLAAGLYSNTADVIADKGDMLLKNKVREELVQRGLDPDQPIDQQVLKEIIGTDSFKKIVNAVSKSRLSGIQVFKTFEALPDGKDGEIGVVILQSKRLTQLADSIFSGNSKLAPSAALGKPLSANIPQDKNILIGTFGVQFIKDDKNQWCLLSYGQGFPKLEKSRYINSAIKKAKLNAMGMIRQFAGEMAESAETKEESESVTDYVDGTQNIEISEDYTAKMRTTSAAQSISGMTQVKSWQHKHPLTGHMVAGSIVSWCPSAMENAKSTQKDMLAPPKVVQTANSNNQNKTNESNITPNQGSYYGSGSTADEDF